MLIDLHVHTNRYSPCGISTPEEMAARAQELGWEAIVLTEHNIVWPLEEARALQARFPAVRILRGIEVTSDRSDDYLIYGITDPDVFRSGMEALDLVRRVRARGGVVVLAHPYRYAETVPAHLDSEPVDGVEVFSNNILGYAHARAQALCARLGAFATAASDAHVARLMGLYAVDFDRPIADERDLAQALRQRAFRLRVEGARVAAENIYVQAHFDQVQELIAQGYDDRTIRDRIGGISATLVRAIREGLDMRRPGEGYEG